VKAKILVVGLLLATGCASVQPASKRTYDGAAVGAAAGGVAGAVIDRHNPWRGGVIGGVIGAVVGGTLAEISERASREAAEAKQPVEYRTEDGRGVYRGQPEGYDPHSRCHTIHERVWEDGRLVKDRVKEICEETSAPAPPPIVAERRTVHAPPVIVEKRRVYAPGPPHQPGPPPWAPAHGYRAKHRYYYYPASYVYFDVERRLYYYSRGDKWHAARSLPRGVHIERTEYILLEMDTEKPYHFHSEVNKRYPPGHGKKSNEHGKKRDRNG